MSVPGTPNIIYKDALYLFPTSQQNSNISRAVCALVLVKSDRQKIIWYSIVYTLQ